MNRIRLAGTGLLAAMTTIAALSGCTLQSATPVDSAPAGDNRPSTVTTEAATDVADAGLSDAAGSTPDEPAANDGLATFGEAYTWEDGLSVTIEAPQAYTPSDYAAGTVAGQEAVTLQITIVNGSDAPFDPVLTMVSAQSGNTEASKIYDTAKDIGGSLSTKILTGRESTYKVAFSVADPSDLVVEFTPDFTHESVLFAS